MKTNAILVAAAAIAALTAAPSQAQYGRLVPAERLVALHATACIGNAPSFEARLPGYAKTRHWDEYGTSAKAKPGDRAWLVAIQGQPAIVDISRQAAAQRCSANAVTDPSAVLALVRKTQGRKPDSVFGQGANGTVSLWRIAPGRSLAVTVPVGQALSRITLEASR